MISNAFARNDARTLSPTLAAALALLLAGHTPALAQCSPTLAQTEGPYWRAGSPERYDLRRTTDTAPANWITLTGRVLDTACNPIPFAWVDVWHADAAGAYDNTSADFRYRGHVFANAAGEFSIVTLKPGLYPGRTRHLHVKVDGTNTPVLTTQLYWPGEPQNATDGIFNNALVMNVSAFPDGSARGAFEFHVAATTPCTAPSITTQPTPLEAPLAVGGNASLTIAYAGTGPASVRWLKDGLELSDGAGIAGSLTTTLTITGATPAHAGTYTCRVGNSCGAPISNAVIVQVGNACPADLDNDGNFANGAAPDDAVDVSDLVFFLAAFEQGSVLVDLDADGVNPPNPDGGVDINDLLFFLLRFEAGC